MRLYVHRRFKGERYTIGDFYADGVLLCNTLEDRDRGLNQSLSLATNIGLKMYGETAIPYGNYEVGIHYWTKYRRYVPILKNVPAFTGILIHNGSTERNTEGCILVGINDKVGRIDKDGVYWMETITKMVQRALSKGEAVTITIADVKPPIKGVGSGVAGIKIK